MCVSIDSNFQPSLALANPKKSIHIIKLAAPSLFEKKSAKREWDSPTEFCTNFKIGKYLSI